MKVLYLVPDAGFFWSHRRELALAVLRSGSDVVVAAPHGPHAERIRAAGFRFRPVALTRSLRPLGIARSIRDVLALYREERPDLVHHVSMRAVLCGGLAARLAGVPAVVNLLTGLGWVFSSGPTPLRRAVEEAYRLALWDPRSWTIFQNPDDHQDFLRRRLASRERSSVILGSGVNLDSFEPRPEPKGPPTVLLASRMLASKGVGDLVEAGRILRNHGFEHRIVLAGAPDAENPSSIPESTLRAWNAAGEARWVGHTDNVATLLAESHVACLPTYYREGVPKFLLEAMASARPIVTTDVPGCRELVPRESSGMLVAPRDPAELADALLSLLTDDSQRHAKGQAARALVVERFSLQRVIRETLDVYTRVSGGAWN
jgi:glycosyltransferase involved in cell wall biosynthesis